MLGLLGGCFALPDEPSVPELTAGTTATSPAESGTANETAAETESETETETTQNTTPAASTEKVTAAAAKSTAATTAGPTVPPPRTTLSTTHTTATAATTTATTATTAPPRPVPPKSETFRAVWVSCLELDKLFSGASVSKAAAALDAIMDNCAKWGMTAVIFHVRAMSDAYYKSTYFPPAKSAAKLLDAGFDPLAYAVEAAHKRGIELHAWVNPYRVGRDKSHARSEDIFTQDGLTYYIPTSEPVKALILNGIRELVNGYGIDGIHFDDYFYPNGAASENTAAAFEKKLYEAYFQEAGSSALAPGGWRRQHVDALIGGVYRTVHSRKNCVFGISPSSDYKKTYSQMYADPKKWMAGTGYIDYLAPQIYFGFSHATVPFDKTVEQWTAYPRARSVNLYVGVAAYKIGLSPDRYAGVSGAGEWAVSDNILARSAKYLHEKGLGQIYFSYTYLFADTARSLDSWTDSAGKTVKQSYNKAVAQREIDNLLAYWG
ncbi:MAG: family 10 glycosylhydrolase [Oscillospiraceae bacterium]|nr:family 10 glycosylhydrolase [Oscillospiraceae bacterium]